MGFEILAERIVQAARQCNLPHRRALGGQLDHPSLKSGCGISGKPRQSLSRMISRWSAFRRRHVACIVALVILIGPSLITRTVAACTAFV